MDDGCVIGTIPQLSQVVDILRRDGPARGLILSTSHTVQAPARPKTTVWSPGDSTGDEDPLLWGVTRIEESGIILLGAAVGNSAYVAGVLEEKVDKITEVTALLPTIEDAHTEFALARSTLTLPKFMFSLRTTPTTDHTIILEQFDTTTKEALGRIMGCPLPPLALQQAKLPVSMGGLGLREAVDHAAAAYTASFLASQDLVRSMLSTPPDSPPSTLPPAVLTSLNTSLGEEVAATQDSLLGVTQRQLSTRIDLANQRLHSNLTRESAGEREVARLASLSLPYAGSWLNCPPMPALNLHLRPTEFTTAVKIRLGLPVYDQAGPCPVCHLPSDTLADHALVCGSGGERILRHNLARDALCDTAVAAGLSPIKEGRNLLPGTGRKPADIFLPCWSGGRDAALDVTVTHPLQAATRAGAAATPGHAMNVSYGRKMAGAWDRCRAANIAFIPIVAESLGGWHPVAVDQIKKLARCLAMHTGQAIEASTAHLFTRLSTVLVRGCVEMVLNRSPTFPSPEIGGTE